MHINFIGFLNTISKYILFSVGSMIKNRKLNNIEDGIKHVNKIYLQRGFNITCIHAHSKFGPLGGGMTDLGVSLNLVSKK